jgi:hypothetical protein
MIQKDWRDRELVEIVEINILHTINFLNQFDVAVRYKLSRLNDKLNKLERTLDYCETAVKTSTSAGATNTDP